jgi:arsenate reductase (thioredoxin)
MRWFMTAICLAGLVAAGCRSSAGERVIFVCEHGAAKSVVAAAYFNKLATQRGLRARAIARGATPQENLARSAVDGLRGDGLAAGLDTPRPLTADDVRGSRRVVTFDCDQATMQGLLGMGTCWGDVPATGQDYPRARDAIRAHVETLIDEMAASRR